MDVSIRLDDPQTTFSNGDTILGCVIVYCPHAVTVSKITASLTGESVLTLTDKTGLLMDWKQQEKHQFVNESQTIAPYRHNTEGTRQDQMKLASGYHSFWFALKVPESPECTCPPNSPVSVPVPGFDKEKSHPEELRKLPPSMDNIVRGAEVIYRINVSVSTTRSMFKSTTKKSININVWPVDTQPPSTAASLPIDAFPCVRAIQASVMGPPNPSSSAVARDRNSYLASTEEPAQVLISANFLPNCNLTRNRNVALRLSVQKLNPYPYDLLLQSFQILLVGYTDIKAGTTKDTQMSSHTIQSLSNIGMTIFPAMEDVGSIQDIDSALWDGKTLPEFVIPSFDACNVSRRYELEISMGFQCRGTNNKGGRVLFVQLRTPVLISSGIFSGRQIGKPVEYTLGSEVPLKSRGDEEPPYYNVAHAINHDNLGAQHRERLSRADSPHSPMPPTYDEAIKLSVKKEWEM